MTVPATAPTLAASSPMTDAERQLVAQHLERTRPSVRQFLRTLPWAGGLAGVGGVCALAAWQTGIVGRLLFGLSSLFFLWPVPSVFKANRHIVKALKQDLQSNAVTLHAGVLARRYYTRGRHGHGRIVLDTGADYAVPVTLLQAMTENEPLTLRVAPASGCLLTVLRQAETCSMPLHIGGASALH